MLFFMTCRTDRSHLHGLYFEVWHGDGVVYHYACLHTWVGSIWLEPVWVWCGYLLSSYAFYALFCVMMNLCLWLQLFLLSCNHFIPWICKHFTNESGILEQIYHEGITTGAFIDDHTCKVNWISLSQVCWISITDYSLFRCSDTVCRYADDTSICVLI